MPHDKLESLLLQRTPVVTNPVKLPESAPGSVEAGLDDFVTGFLGDQKAGSLPAALGATAGTLNPGRFLKAGGMLSDLITSTKKVAPKRAAKELADLLLGRSSRVPTQGIYKQIPEADASLQAMMMTRTGSIPSPATTIRITPGDPNFKTMKRVLPRNPGITEDYANMQRVRGNVKQYPSDYRTTTDVNSYNSDFRAATKNNLSSQEPRAGQIADDLRKTKSITESVGKSIHEVGLKPFTKNEIKAMMTGPVKAYERGMMSRKEMKAVLASNRAKIEQFNKDFAAKDFEIYEQMQEQALARRRGK